MFLSFIKSKNECQHINVPLDVEEAYCPDCGALIKNKWYLVRCKCCNIKRKAHFEYKEIKPNSKFCPNCGGYEFYLEEIKAIDCTNLNYVLHKKEIEYQNNCYVQQIWAEKEENTQIETKLIAMKKGEKASK